MGCDQKPESLAAYLDGELPADQAAKVQEHLSACPRCAAEIASHVSLRRTLASARQRFRPSAEFKRKMERKFAARPRRQIWALELAGALIAVLVVAALLGWKQSAQRTEAFREVADLHVSALASTNPLDVVSTDRHTVKPWFQGRIPFSFNLPELSGTEFNLLGARMVYLQQQPAAQLLVAMRQHKISVFIVSATADSSRLFVSSGGVKNRGSFNVESWESHDLRMIVIGDAEQPEVDRLAQLLMQANQ